MQVTRQDVVDAAKYVGVLEDLAAWRQEALRTEPSKGYDERVIDIEFWDRNGSGGSGSDTTLTLPVSFAAELADWIEQRMHDKLAGLGLEVGE